MYIKRAKGWRNRIFGVFSVLGTIAVAFVFWAICSYIIIMVTESIGHSEQVQLVSVLVTMTGFVWFPALCALLMRDICLRHCIRKQIVGCACGACGYSLIGLVIAIFEEQPTVTCPECGLQTKLSDRGLSQADIDPTLLANESSSV